MILNIHRLIGQFLGLRRPEQLASGAFRPRRYDHFDMCGQGAEAEQADRLCGIDIIVRQPFAKRRVGSSVRAIKGRTVARATSIMSRHESPVPEPRAARSFINVEITTFQPSPGVPMHLIGGDADIGRETLR